MKRDTFIQLPQDVGDSMQLRRFLSSLIEKLDIAFGNRGDNPFASSEEVDNKLTEVGTEYNTLASSTATTLEGLREDINKLRDIYAFRDGSNIPQPVSSSNIVTLSYLEDKLGNPVVLPDKLQDTADLSEVINKVNDLIDILSESKVLGGN